MGEISEIDDVRLTGKSAMTKNIRGPITFTKSKNGATSLVNYLIQNKMVRLVPLAKLYKARQLYIASGYTESAIAQELDITTDIVRSWVVQFDWKERRNEILYSKFCDLREIQLKKGGKLDERHDRIAASVEDIIEDMITKHARGDGELNAKDIGALVKAIQSLQTVRRTIHSKPAQKTETVKKIELDTSDNFNNMAMMLSGMFGAVPTVERIKPAEVKLIENTEADSLDIEVKPIEVELVKPVEVKAKLGEAIYDED